MLNNLFVVMIFPITIAIGQVTKDEAALLMQLDPDFDKATAKKGVDGWVAFIRTERFDD
jgi:hypothetical protein